MSIQSLPIDSPHLGSRYIQLCNSLLRVGDLQGATEAYTEAERLSVQGCTDPGLILARASLFLNQGDFKSAACCYDGLNHANFDKLAVINNIGLCFEHLGDLNKAKRFFSQAEKAALQNGHFSVQIISLSNRASVETKMGRVLSAQNIQRIAMDRIVAAMTREQYFDTNSFMSVYADASIQYMHTADFKRAAKYIKFLKPARGWVYRLSTDFFAS